MQLSLIFFGFPAKVLSFILGWLSSVSTYSSCVSVHARIFTYFFCGYSLSYGLAKERPAHPVWYRVKSSIFIVHWANTSAIV